MAPPGACRAARVNDGAVRIGRGRTARAGDRYRSRSMAAGRSRIPPRAISPRASTARPRWSIPAAFRWTRRPLGGRARPTTGRLRAARRHLSAPKARSAGRGAAGALRDLGVTAIELMPVADFAGIGTGAMTASPCSRRGAPTAGRTICARWWTRAHASASSVLLDVVYNHFGPEGAYLPPFIRDLHGPQTPGAARSTSTRGEPRGAAFHRRQRRSLDPRVSRRRPAPRRDACARSRPTGSIVAEIADAVSRPGVATAVRYAEDHRNLRP